MVDMSYLTLKRNSTPLMDGDTAVVEAGMPFKAKAQIRTEFHQRPDTDHHPCNVDQDYRCCKSFSCGQQFNGLA